MKNNNQTLKLGINDESVRREINRNIKNPFDAFNEFIWNAVDSGAKNILINIDHDSKYLKQLSIVDDGKGINYEKLDQILFGKFNFSQKLDEKEKNQSLPHGNKGFGRFAFIKFCNDVEWETVYKDNFNKNYQYKIKIYKNSLDNYERGKKTSTTKQTGTKVVFNFECMKECGTLTSSNSKDILDRLKENICLEFCWIIELLGLTIKINNTKLDYSKYKEPTINTSKKIKDHEFEIKFIKWHNQLKNQSSRYYFLNSNGEEVYVNTTTLNNKGDGFYHSIFIKSSYFDSFNILKTKGEKIFNLLIDFIDKYLKKQRKPHIEKFAEKKYEKFKKEDILPKFNKFEEKVKKPLYEKAVKEVISFAPSLVSSKTNNYQIRVLLQLINRLLDDECSRNTLYEILAVLLDDENKEYLEELKRQLDNYGLKNILGTVKLIEDRLITISLLRDMHKDNKFYCDESDLQNQIEEHFWIFGEEYHLMLCAEEDDFTKLRNLYITKILNKDKKEYEQKKVSQKQVDLFICGSVAEGQKTNRNLIVEIKHPDKSINYGNFRQIEDYSRIINKTDGLNNPHRDKWDFILLCQSIVKDDMKEFDDRFIDGFSGLIYDNKKNIRIYVKRWSDLLRDVEDRLKFLKEKLEIKKKHYFLKSENKTTFLDKFDNSAKIKT